MDKEEGVELWDMELDDKEYEYENEMVLLIVNGRDQWGIMDTAAKSIWMDKTWFK